MADDRTMPRSEMTGHTWLLEGTPDNKIPAVGVEPLVAKRVIEQDIVLDGIPERNLATFVTTWMEPEAQ